MGDRQSSGFPQTEQKPSRRLKASILTTTNAYGSFFEPFCEPHRAARGPHQERTAPWECRRGWTPLCGLSFRSRKLLARVIQPLFAREWFPPAILSRELLVS